MKDQQGWASIRTLGLIGAAIYLSGLAGMGFSISQIADENDSGFYIIFCIVMACLVAFGWALTSGDRKVRGRGFWNYRPNASWMWLLGLPFVLFGINASIYTLLSWIEARSSVDGFSMGLLVIAVLAILLGVALVSRDKGRATEANIGGDTNIERQ
jgi:drug/metabolite transporter (DMT)-like permease